MAWNKVLVIASISIIEHIIASTLPTASPFSESPGSSNGFNISLLFTSTVTENYKAAFVDAGRRWEQIITQSLPATVTLTRDYLMTNCNYDVITPQVTIEDLLIGVDVASIDGQGKILGQSAPCLLDNTGIPRFGIMQFDTADVENMIAMGTFNSVILHEMGHVLGIGTLWEYHDLIDKDWFSAPDYTGDQGNYGNEEIGGSGQATIEDQGGQGTAYGHWKETIYDTELMTGWAESNVAMPLSRLTARSLGDLGYTINPDASDEFRIGTSGRRRRLRGEKVQIHQSGHEVKPFTGIVIDGIPKPGRDDDFEKAKKRHELKRGKLASGGN